ncbi:3-phosphoglycerate dehydrogenase [Xaviernesmea oryzae]|uniref:3-phosphoglycerate dehydrogenase n=1 Tax=Xaviernesmea oryzae TaxID=464029 RepID=A0A1Q9AR65_9HYPH|nr:NAD(P)-dependent oxidoreductase [Xaviernesmea oryzae]OLP57922.1 3-phosphoglycerate dehydrogenase [Xaviernesmea oryzae]SEL30727.1 D-3-phosphoglycerate dehydrogenase [Xaviernesmea oryzae]
MKCLVVQPIHVAGLTRLREAGVEPVLCPDTEIGTITRLIGDCEAVVTRDAGLSAEAIAAAACLRVIVSHGAGHDAIDKVAAERRGILVCNTPGANARSVSELALGLAIAAARLIPAADRSVRAGEKGFRETGHFHELFGKTALIIGWGATAQGLGRMLDTAFGMRVLVYSPRSTGVLPYQRVTTLKEGLGLADLISLHTPLREETRNLFDAGAFAAVKRGAILVNTARAGLVDEAALASALADGTIAGAGLDVYSPGAAQGPLGASDRVIFTPHLGGTTGEALERVAFAAAGHVLTALSGNRPETTIVPQAVTA